MSNVERITAKVQELMATGKTMQEAMQEVLTAELKPTTAKDNVGKIKELRNLPELRRVKKIAYAKISKSKGKEDSIARYKEEIKACETRINELIAEITASEVPWKKSMELGEDAAGALNYFLADYKTKIEEELGKKTKGMTNAKIKSALQETKATVPQDIPEELKAPLMNRIERGDMLVITLCKTVSFLQTL
jgi:DNA repair exonuclease SbcCD ATPase subunit